MRICQIADEWLAANLGLRARFHSSPAAAGERAWSLVAYVSDRRGHDRRYAIDAAKIERELGFLPKVDLERGLQKTFPWFWKMRRGDERSWMAATGTGSGLNTAPPLPGKPLLLGRSGRKRPVVDGIT